MASELEICNAALLFLGAETINAFNEDTLESRACTLNYPISRQAVLRLHPWNFATKRIQLARSTSTPEFRYKFEYPLPADFIRLLAVYDNLDYKVERRSIITDDATCYIKYVFDNQQTETWDPLFVDVMVARLAMDLSYLLPRASTMIDRALQMYNIKLTMAKGMDASEDIEDRIGQGDDSLIMVRY